MQEQQPVAHTSHTDITLDQLGGIQPGLARLMAEVSDRYWILYYAAKGGNWKLAALQSSELEKALRIGEITRPKYTAHMEAFIKGPLTAMNKAIEKRDWITFESVYKTGIITANAYHREWNHEEIVWQLPDEPPKHLRLTAGE
jgi:hypothetical protein